MHMAGMAAPLVEDLVIYSNGDEKIAKQMAAAVEGKRVSVEPRKIVAIERKDSLSRKSDVIVRFEDGGSKVETFMVSSR